MVDVENAERPLWARWDRIGASVGGALMLWIGLRSGPFFLSIIGALLLALVLFGGPLARLALLEQQHKPEKPILR